MSSQEGPGSETPPTEEAAAVPTAPAQGFTYAAKFLCGRFKGEVGPVAPGHYTTAINVRNPNLDITLTVHKTAILLFPLPSTTTPPETPVPPGKPSDVVNFRSNWGFEIDCADIREVLLKDNQFAKAEFLKGWVVIQSTHPLNVVAVYTVRGMDSGGNPTPPVSIAIERVPNA